MKTLAHITSQNHTENSSLVHWLSTNSSLVIGAAVLLLGITAVCLVIQKSE
jgi:hypothetical protein